jgi:hypothetical protein
MKMVEGRRDSLLLLPNGRILTPRAFGIAMRMFRFYRHIDQFRVIQKKPDLFELNIKMKDNSLEESFIEVELAAHLKKMFKLDFSEMKFEIRFVEGIPLNRSGKLMMVVSELESDAFLGE